jgi:hypothetical protein
MRSGLVKKVTNKIRIDDHLLVLDGPDATRVLITVSGAHRVSANGSLGCGDAGDDLVDGVALAVHEQHGVDGGVGNALRQSETGQLKYRYN